MPLFVKKLDPRAIMPTCSHPGEDLGYDLYALEGVVLVPGEVTRVRTGIAAEHRRALIAQQNYEVNGYGYISNVVTPFYEHVSDGLLIRDRSSMAAKGITVSGGVIDAGYRDEIIVLLTHHAYLTDDQLQYKAGYGYGIGAGDKIAQMIPIPVLSNEDVVQLEEFDCSTLRGTDGFGSTGL